MDVNEKKAVKSDIHSSYKEIWKDLIVVNSIVVNSDKIENEELKEGDMIPSENELQQIYGVSRATVRKAIITRAAGVAMLATTSLAATEGGAEHFQLGQRHQPRIRAPNPRR